MKKKTVFPRKNLKRIARVGKKAISRKENTYSHEDETAIRSLFDAVYYLSENKDVAEEGVDPFDHFMTHGWKESRNPSAIFNTTVYIENNPELLVENINPLYHFIKNGGEIAELSAPGKKNKRTLLSDVEARRFFDEAYYLIYNKDVASSGMEPFHHFMQFGWKEFRNPSQSFDLIWYVQYYLEGDWTINPYKHYLHVGESRGYLTSPQTPVKFSEPVSYGRKKKIKRICLFAGYDVDGLIDSTVVEYVANLSLFADVYFLGDCIYSTGELEKLKPYVKGAWGEPHKLYDFGSWSKLAKHYVGWNKIDKYDELILVNDSAYLMHSFDAVFKEMDGQKCDWWGLQATKGLASTIGLMGQRLSHEVDIEDVKSHLLSGFEMDRVYDFLIGSYFLTFRKPVMSNDRFRNVLNGVSRVKTKKLLIREYEVGLTRLLISLGFEFSTFEKTVYPFQPVFTEKSFELIEKGFPLLKKYHLIENHYSIPELLQWKEKLQEAGIKKDLTPYAANLTRTGNAEKIFHNHDIDRKLLNPPLSNAAMLAMDSSLPKYDDWWVFPVCAFSHRFNDNVRALFEHLKDDPSIKKIVLTRSKFVNVDGKNVHVYPLNSREGQFYLLRARHIFLKHSVNANTGLPLSKKHHSFHNLWHGVPLKRIGYCSLDFQDKLGWVEKENKMLSSVIASSKVDQLAMAAAYWPLTINDVWCTGLPRQDLILKADEQLPDDMQAQVKDLREVIGNRKLVIFAPTFRLNQDEGYYKFTEGEIKKLSRALKRKGFVLGIREHMADKKQQYSSQLRGDCFISLSEAIYPNVEILMREAIALITDYSSIFIDFLMTGRPVISFAYDYEHYTGTERGLFYDLKWCFPGVIAESFSDMLAAIKKVDAVQTDEELNKYNHRRSIFIDYYDGKNSERVVEKVKNLSRGDRTVFEVASLKVTEAPKIDITWVFDPINEITARYRIYNMVPEFQKLGITCKIVHSNELTPGVALQSKMLVFSRVQATERILDLVEGFQRLGRKVIFDIDDLIFNESVLVQSEFYAKRPKLRGKTRNLARNYNKLLLQADLVTVSTAALVKHVKSMGKNVVCVPNSISSGIIHNYMRNSSAQEAESVDTIRICYLSGSQTHGEDFKIIRDVMRDVREDYPNVECHVVGAVAFDQDENDYLLEGWFRHDIMSYEKMHDFLSKFDINLAPLTRSKFNDCKSELKFFEAALHSVPVIASPSASYLNCIDHNKNGCIADTPEEWLKSLTVLISNSKKRKSMGVRAHKEALQMFSASKVAGDYVEYLVENYDL